MNLGPSAVAVQAACAPILAEAVPSASAALPDFGSAVLRMLLALGIVLTLLFVVARFLPSLLRRMGPARPQGALKVVSSARLDAKSSVHLVEVEGQRFLLGASEAGVTRIAEFVAFDLDRPAGARAPGEIAPAGGQPDAARGSEGGAS